jgi:ribonuclease P protein component
MIMAKQFGLGKRNRLKSRREIDSLFEKGKHFTVFPLRVIYQFEPAPTGVSLQAGVTASKRHFKKAVDRNRVKRLLREAYRLQKNELVKELDARKLKGFLFFVYTDATIAPFALINERMQACLKRLLQHLPK